MLISTNDYNNLSINRLKAQNKMKQKIKDLFRKVCNKLFRKKTHGTIWGQKFDGRMVLSTHPNVISKKWRITPLSQNSQ